MHLIIRKIKNHIKTHPRLYDLLNFIRPIESNMEKWLDSFSKVNNRNINFVQIGASDGLRWDNVRRFIIRDKWNGIFVEPLPDIFEMLKKNYSHLKNQKLIFVNVAVSSKNGESILWSYSDKFCDSLSFEDKLFYLRKSSFDKTHVEASLKNFDDIEDKMKCLHIRCMSLNSLVQEYWDSTKIDLILIDTEGHDDTIIRTIDFKVIRPKAICFESHNLGLRKQDIYDYLSEKGYKVSELNGDSVAVYNP